MARHKSYTTGPFYERAILVGVNLRNLNNNWSIDDSLSELSQLRKDQKNINQ